MSDLVQDPVLRQRYRFERRSRADGAPYLEIEVWCDPGGGVTPHVHPTRFERFEILEGRAQLLSGRTWRELGPGEAIDVTPGTRHAFRNRSDSTVHFRTEASPPESLEAFLTDAAALSQQGKLMRPGLPRGLGGLLGAAVLAKRYRNSTRLELPPVWVQRLLLDPLVPWAERHGYRAGRMAEAP
jgi:quercetin dioxygenase-like cupin family protein